MAIPGWVQEVFSSIDEMDADKFVSFLTEDATFVFGNNPGVKGKKTVKQAVAGFFSVIGGLSHTITKCWETKDAVICYGNVTYTRKDESTITLPFADVFEMKGGKVKNYLIFMDISPLFSPQK